MPAFVRKQNVIPLAFFPLHRCSFSGCSSEEAWSSQRGQQPGFKGKWVSTILYNCICLLFISASQQVLKASLPQLHCPHFSFCYTVRLSPEVISSPQSSFCISWHFCRDLIYLFIFPCHLLHYNWGLELRKRTA